jgi:hypothetical protein
MISVSGADTGVLATQVLFDSGTPDVLLNIPPSTSFPASVDFIREPSDLTSADAA